MTETAGDGRGLRRTRNAASLYDAAMELFTERRYEDVTVEEICERAGVGRATFFRIYENKAGLLREFNRQLATDARQRLASTSNLDVRAALHAVRLAIVHAWRRPTPGQVALLREVLGTMPVGDPHAVHPELLAVVTEVITSAVTRGELPATPPPDLAASLALLQMVAAVAYAVHGHESDIDELSRVLLDQWLHGMTQAPDRGAKQGASR